MNRVLNSLRIVNVSWVVSAAVASILFGLAGETAPCALMAFTTAMALCVTMMRW